MRPELQQKYQQLQEHIRSMESAAVAFSGGVDSSLLLAVAQKILGNKVIALTARSCVSQAGMGRSRRLYQKAGGFSPGH